MSTLFRHPPHRSRHDFAPPPRRTCDRCGAPAVAVSHHVAGDLAWCRHHLRELAPVFEARAVPVSALHPV